MKTSAGTILYSIPDIAPIIANILSQTSLVNGIVIIAEITDAMTMRDANLKVC